MREHSGKRAAVGAVAVLLLVAGLGCVRLRDANDGTPSAGALVLAQVVESPVATSTAAPSAATATATPAAASTTPAATAAAATPPPTETPPAVVAESPTPIPCRLGAVEDSIGVESEESLDDGGGKRNGIKLCNRKDERLRIRGRVQLNRVMSDTVRPANESLAWASCRDCSTLTVALQLNLYRRTASVVAPTNSAVAYNYRCLRCRTLAVAYQYSLPVDDPNEVPDDARELVKEMNAELRALHSDSSVSLLEAATRVDAVVARFQALAANLDQRRQEESADDTPDN